MSEILSRKQEEEILRKFVDGLQPGSYIRMLLSDQLISWFLEMMAYDFSTDLFQVYCESVEEKNHLIADLERDINQLKQDNTTCLLSLDSITEERDDLRTAKVKVEDQMYQYKATAFKYDRLTQKIREIASLIRPE